MPAELHGEIAYVLKEFPRLSETFIANEIQLLEEQGLRLKIFSVKRADNSPRHAAVAHIKAPVIILPPAADLAAGQFFSWLRQTLPLFGQAHGKLLLHHPWRYIKTLLTSLSMCYRYRSATTGKLKKVFIKEFLQAGYIAWEILPAGTIRHLHGHFCHGATTITWLASELTGLPFSFTAHAKDIYEERQNPGDLLERKLRAARFVTTCTGANARHLAALYPRLQVVHTIYHGLNPRYFVPGTKTETSLQPPLILAVGRFVEKKGFRYLIEACAQLRRNGKSFRCLILGERDEQYLPLLERIRELGLQAQICIAAPVTQEQLREIYQQAAIFVLPCLVTAKGDRDGIPNVLVEAMASGLAVVSTDISGIPELIEHRHNGLLVPEKNSQVLAENLMTLLLSPELRRQLGKNARVTVCERFDSTKTTRALKELFVACVQSYSPAV